MNQPATGATWSARIRTFFHEGNVRHVIVEKEGRRAADLPLTVVVIAALLAVWAVAILAVIAVAAGYTISVERTGQADVGAAETPPEEGPAPAETPGASEATSGGESAEPGPTAE